MLIITILIFMFSMFYNNNYKKDTSIKSIFQLPTSIEDSILENIEKTTVKKDAFRLNDAIKSG